MSANPNSNSADENSQVLKPERKVMGMRKKDPVQKAPKKLEWKITKAQLVYVIKNEFAGESCPICRYGLSSPCLKCEANGLESCTVVEGKCGHFYHLHCIDPWAKKHMTCPVCGQPWAEANRY